MRIFIIKLVIGYSVIGTQGNYNNNTTYYYYLGCTVAEKVLQYLRTPMNFET